jgi:hypothetical protein
MMRRFGALAWKEAREHYLVVLLLLCTLPFAWGIFILAAFGAPTTVTYLEAHASFSRWVLPLAGLALGNRLVVVELHGRTQRFLESLPLRRYEPLIVKFVFGLVLLEGIALGELVLTELVALTREPFELTFLAILAARTSVYVAFGWCLFFTMGLFGKARVPVYVLMVFGLILVSSTTQLELMHFGPIALVAPEMTMNRTDWPWSAIGVSLGLGVGLCVIGGAISMLREGSVQERLAKPMSQRDLAMLGIAVMALLTLWGAFEHEAEPLPYRMGSVHVLYSETWPIAIGYGDTDAEADAHRLMVDLEHDVAAIADLLGRPPLPQMRVVLRRSLDRGATEPVGLSHADGMLVRANYLGASDDQLDAISAAVIEGMLDARTRGRAHFEPRRWLRDGLAIDVAYGVLPAARRAQACWATSTRGPDAPRMDHYQRLRESVGDDVAASLAATGIATLRAHHADLGPLVRMAFPVSPTMDVRATLDEWRHPLRSQIAETMGLDRAALTHAWGETIASMRAEPDVARIALSLPHASATVTIERDESHIVSIVTRATIAPSSEGLTLSVRHLAIGPFDHVTEDYAMPRETVTVAADGHAEVSLRGRYTSGDRVLVRVDLEGTILGAPMRLAAVRLDIPAGDDT